MRTKLVKTPPEQVPTASRTGDAQYTQDAPGSVEETVIPVVQEELDVGTRRIETDSGVRVRMRVEERVQVVDEPLTRDDLEIERVAVERVIDAPVDVRYEGDTMIVPVLEEVLVVEKRLVLKEEVRITRRRTEHRSPTRVPLRRESAVVERFDADGTGPAETETSHIDTAQAYERDSLIDRRMHDVDAQRRGLSAAGRSETRAVAEPDGRRRLKDR
jgi:uncharacterized protein (TIGR02271 family)